MRHQALRHRAQSLSLLFFFVLLWFPAVSSAEERALFAYVDGNNRGCFAHISKKEWVEFTGSGETRSFQEVARDADRVQLLDSSRDGVGVRLFAKDSQWNHAQETGGKWLPLRRGSWVNAVDLRPDFRKYGLKPRLQGERNTCSVHTTVGALEFGRAKKLDKPAILSVEFLNWASNQVAGDQVDGSFFIDCLNGFRKYGICPEAMMPHRATFDPNYRPSSAALARAESLRREVMDSFHVHWIMPPVNEKPGLTARQFAEIKATLCRGYPVAFGSAHSVLLVGFKEDPKRPGGGDFFVRDSTEPDFVATTFEHVRTRPFDVFWVDFQKKPEVQRQEWSYRAGVFKNVGPDKWTEIGDNGGKFYFREVTRNPDYVELYEEDRQLTLRIYGQSFSKLFYKMPNMRQWALMYDGKWVGSANSSQQTNPGPKK